MFEFFQGQTVDTLLLVTEPAAATDLLHAALNQVVTADSSSELAVWNNVRPTYLECERRIQSVLNSLSDIGQAVLQPVGREVSEEESTLLQNDLDQFPMQSDSRQRCALDVAYMIRVEDDERQSVLNLIQKMAEAFKTQSETCRSSSSADRSFRILPREVAYLWGTVAREAATALRTLVYSVKEDLGELERSHDTTNCMKMLKTLSRAQCLDWLLYLPVNQETCKASLTTLEEQGSEAWKTLLRPNVIN